MEPRRQLLNPGLVAKLSGHRLELVVQTAFHSGRQGDAADMCPNSGKHDHLIRIWKRLPVWLTRTIDPEIVCRIP